MHARLPVHTLRDAITPVAALVNEALLLPDEDQLRIHGVTEDRTATVTVEIDSDVFTTFTTADRSVESDDQPGRFDGQPVGIDAKTLTAFLDFVSPTAPLNCSSPPHSDLVTLSTDAMRYRVKPIDPQYVRRRDTENLPEQPQVSVTMPSEFHPLKHSLRAAGLCSQTIRIYTDQDDPVLGFTATGPNDSMRYQVSHDELRSSDTTTTTAIYPLDKLQPMYESVSPRAEELTVLIDDDQILFLTANHSQTTTRTRFILAPETSDSKSNTTQEDALPSSLAYRTREERRVSGRA